MRDLPELITHDVISAETADRIRSFYTERQQSMPNRLLVVFGVLGALLTGMGIVLIIAHNWDSIGRVGKLGFALIPLLAGQVACGYTLWRRSLSAVWKEASATFLFFAIAASISIVSQVYNVEGKLGDFLFLWMLLSWPVIYAMRSSMASLLYIIGITWYACQVGYFEYPGQSPLAYWPFLIAAIPHYAALRKTQGNFFHFHSWFICLSLSICLGTLHDGQGELMTLAYTGMFCAMLLLGQMKPFNGQRLITNAFLVAGSIGIISMLLSLSFRGFWYGLKITDIRFSMGAHEFTAAIAATLVAGFLLYRKWNSDRWSGINPKSWSFILLILLFAVGFSAPFVSVIAVNVLLLVYSVTTIISGARKKSFGILNYGLLILTALITCRFFDTDLSFIVRGLLFIVVGAGFFVFNFYMIKRKGEAS